MSVNDMFYPKDKEFTKAERRAFAREELVYNVTEDILLLLEDMGVSKKDLARRLGKSPSFVTQVLSGARNMTLGTLSDICFAVGAKPSITVFAKSSFTKLNAPWTEVELPEAPPAKELSTRVFQVPRQKAAWEGEEAA